MLGRDDLWTPVLLSPGCENELSQVTGAGTETELREEAKGQLLMPTGEAHPENGIFRQCPTLQSPAFAQTAWLEDILPGHTPREESHPITWGPSGAPSGSHHSPADAHCLLVLLQ